MTKENQTKHEATIIMEEIAKAKNEGRWSRAKNLCLQLAHRFMILEELPLKPKS